MNAANSEECMVNGALLLALWLSRFAGMAPIRFNLIRNGYRISVSHYNAWFSYTLITLFNVLGCMVIFLDYTKQTSFHWENLFFYLNVTMKIIMSSRGSYYGIRRMKLMIIHLNALEEIKVNMGGKNYNEKSQTRARIVIIILHLIVITVLPTAKFVINYKNLEYMASISFLVHYIQLATVCALQAQIVLMFLEIHSSLVVIKNNMIALNTVEYPVLSTTRNDLSCLLRAYITVCDVVAKLNKEDGVIVLLVFCYIITKILNIGCILSSLSSSATESANRILEIVWCIVNVVDFLAFVESFHLIYNEVTNIKIELIKLMFKITEVGRRVPIELQSMYKLMNLNKITFCPLSMFTLERTLTIKILSGLITYYLFIIQLKQS